MNFSRIDGKPLHSTHFATTFDRCFDQYFNFPISIFKIESIRNSHQIFDLNEKIETQSKSEANTQKSISPVTV